MKLFITFLFVYSFSFGAFPHGEEETFPDSELNIQLQNAPNRTITFEMIPVGMNWAKTSECEFLMYDDQTTYISSLTAGSLGYIDCSYNGFEYRFNNEGNYTTVDHCAQSTAGLKPLRNGFYQINIKENNQLKTYAYFDCRDRGFPIANCNTCSGNDMTIRYDGDNEELWFWNKGRVNISNQNPNVVLENRQLITWSEMKCNNPITSTFEDYWENALVMTNNGSNKPRIVWGPYQTGSQPESYKIYRCVTSGTPQNFSHIGTTNNNEFIFVDEEYTIWSSSSVKAYYKVLPYAPSESFSYSNTVHTGVPLFKNNNNMILDDFKFNLSQNYPNPFNPTTNISFSIQNKGRVLLKVYDVLGKEIETLVDGEYQPGLYDVNFNATNLPSGVYFYSILTNDFMQTNKMILAK